MAKPRSRSYCSKVAEASLRIGGAKLMLESDTQSGRLIDIGREIISANEGRSSSIRAFKQYLDFSTRHPEHFEAVMAPAIGDLSARPAEKPKCRIKVSGGQFSRLALFIVHADSIRVGITPPHRYVGLYLPLGQPLIISENCRKSRFLHDIHLLKPDRELSLDASKGCRVLVANLFSVTLREYALRLTAADAASVPPIANRIAISSPCGLLLSRCLAHLWSELHRSGSFPDNDIAIREAEDALIALFAERSETGGGERHNGERPASASATIRAEEYLTANLTAPVSQADLATAAGVSIRSLSRGFKKRHGLGPMQFLKVRRLDAAHRELLGADVNSTTVTEVASRYGFCHLGRFAVEYRQVFGESPSTTLKG